MNFMVNFQLELLCGVFEWSQTDRPTDRQTERETDIRTEGDRPANSLTLRQTQIDMQTVR